MKRASRMNCINANFAKAGKFISVLCRQANKGLPSTVCKPSKLLTSTVTHNFDRGSQKIKKIVKLQGAKRHPLSKAFKYKIFFNMPKKM